MTDAQPTSTSHSNTPPSATREVSSESSTPPRPPPAPRPTDGAGRASFLVPCLPPVPGGAAAARVEGAPPADARGAKRARHAE